MANETKKQPMKVVWTICGKEITIEADEDGNVFVDGDLVERAKAKSAVISPSPAQGDIDV